MCVRGREGGREAGRLLSCAARPTCTFARLQKEAVVCDVINDRFFILLLNLLRSSACCEVAATRNHRLIGGFLQWCFNPLALSFFAASDLFKLLKFSRHSPRRPGMRCPSSFRCPLFHSPPAWKVFFQRLTAAGGFPSMSDGPGGGNLWRTGSKFHSCSCPLILWLTWLTG